MEKTLGNIPLCKVNEDLKPQRSGFGVVLVRNGLIDYVLLVNNKIVLTVLCSVCSVVTQEEVTRALKKSRVNY